MLEALRIPLSLTTVPWSGLSGPRKRRLPACDALQPLAPACSRMGLVSPSKLGQLNVITTKPLLLRYLGISLLPTPISDLMFESCFAMYTRFSCTSSWVSLHDPLK